MTIATRTGQRLALTCLDRSGASVSTLCAIHCALMPLVVALLPLIGLEFLADERTEVALLGLSVAIGLASLGLGFALHRHKRVAAALLVGFLLLASGRAAESAQAEVMGTTLTVGGGLSVAASHLMSRRCC